MLYIDDIKEHGIDMIRYKLLVEKSKERKLELKLINIIREFKLDPLYIAPTKELKFT